MKTRTTLLAFLSIGFSCLSATLTVDTTHPIGAVSPKLYGLMTEEINHSYDGGIYAELIQNRAFLDSTNSPAHWSTLTNDGCSIALDTAHPFNDALTTSLRFTATQGSKQHPSTLANDGYWGIPVYPHTQYRATLIARAESGFNGPLTLAIVSEDGQKTFASAKLSGLTTEWKKFEVRLKTGGGTPTTKARFVISLAQPGSVWFSFVSLFPPTWNDRPNGLRKDLMQMLVDLNPKFLRFPGGNYVEGDTLETRFDWKKTIGPIEQRHGHQCPWGYRSTDGLGLLEFLEWCEDMKAEPVLAVYAGYCLKGAHVNPGPDLQPYVLDALDEIEYVIGDTRTTWGARRLQDGHPAPFKLTCVEIGNEDWFDKSKSYDDRFAQFYDAIKIRYPQLKLISTIGNDQPEKSRVHTRNPDITDEHYYRPAEEFIRTSPEYARNYPRSGPIIFVGEWAAYENPKIKPWDPGARKQGPTPSMLAALGDAAFMAAIERNSDLILMQCYAPLFVNVNPGARQWRPDLIGYDAISSFGCPSYYAFQMFSRNVGDQLLPITSSDTSVQGCATRDTHTGEIFLKLVNPRPTAEILNIKLQGCASVASKATGITLSADPEDTNSITDPRKVAPITATLRNLKPQFTHTLLPNSIVVLKLNPR